MEQHGPICNIINILDHFEGHMNFAIILFHIVKRTFNFIYGINKVELKSVFFIIIKIKTLK